MKKIICVVLALSMLLSLSACAGGPNANVDNTPKEISLTVDNIADYVAFESSFADSEYSQGILFYVSSSTLEFQAYSTAAGTFKNVEITLRANIDDTGAYDEQWHLVDKYQEDIEFTFKLSSNGSFSHKYAIECFRNAGTLKGSCDFTVVSVSGTFIPS